MNISKIKMQKSKLTEERTERLTQQSWIGISKGFAQELLTTETRGQKMVEG